MTNEQRLKNLEAAVLGLSRGAHAHLAEKYGLGGYLPQGLAAQDEGARLLRNMASLAALFEIEDAPHAEYSSKPK